MRKIEQVNGQFPNNLVSTRWTIV